MLLSHQGLGNWRYPLYISAILVALFLLVPIIFIVLLSFGSSRWLAFPPPGYTTRWYSEFLQDPSWMQAVLTSLKVAVTATLITLLLAIPASLSLVRGTFRGKDTLFSFFSLPMIVPLVITAIAVYSVVLKLGLAGTFPAFILTHVMVALPMTVITITNALRLFDMAVENAAVSCGMPRLRAILQITLPSISSGITAAALFAFLTSWDEVVLSIFMASPTLQTLPVKMWGTLRQDLSPAVAVASSLMIVLTVVLMLLIGFFNRLNARRLQRVSEVS